MFHRQLQEGVNAEETQDKTNQNTPTEEKDNTMSDSENTSAGMADGGQSIKKEETAPATPRQFDIPETAPFQKVGSLMASRQAGGYSSSYQGSGNAASSSSQASDRRLVVGPGITMSGEIDSCDTLVVQGTVEAALKGASVLDVSEEGIFYGTVEINEAVISGRVEGDITVNGRLTITSTGSVTGSIAYRELVVEAGATLDGKITPLASVGAAVTQPKGKASVVKGSTPDNDNEGESEELPFAAGTAAAG